MSTDAPSAAKSKNSSRAEDLAVGALVVIAQDPHGVFVLRPVGDQGLEEVFGQIEKFLPARASSFLILAVSNQDQQAGRLPPCGLINFLCAVPLSASLRSHAGHAFHDVRGDVAEGDLFLRAAGFEGLSGHAVDDAGFFILGESF